MKSSENPQLALSTSSSDPSQKMGARSQLSGAGLCFKKRTCLESPHWSCHTLPESRSAPERPPLQAPRLGSAQSVFGHCPDTCLKEKVLEKEKSIWGDRWVCILDMWPQMTEQLQSMGAGVCRNFREGAFLNQGS